MVATKLEHQSPREIGQVDHDARLNRLLRNALRQTAEDHADAIVEA